jgi:hypothetical protein
MWWINASAQITLRLRILSMDFEQKLNEFIERSSPEVTDHAVINEMYLWLSEYVELHPNDIIAAHKFSVQLLF